MNIRHLLNLLLMFTGAGFLLLFSWRYFDQAKNLNEEIKPKRNQYDFIKIEETKKFKQAEQAGLEYDKTKVGATYLEALAADAAALKIQSEALNKEIRTLSERMGDHTLYGWVFAIIGFILPIGYFILRHAVSKYPARSVLSTLLVLVGSGAFLFYSWKNFTEANNLTEVIAASNEEVNSYISQSFQNLERSFRSGELLTQSGLSSYQSRYAEIKANHDSLRQDIQLLTSRQEDLRLYGWVCAILGPALAIGYFTLRWAASRYAAVEP